MISDRGLLLLLVLTLCCGFWIGVWSFGKWTFKELTKYKSEWAEINDIYPDHRRMIPTVDYDGVVTWEEEEGYATTK